MLHWDWKKDFIGTVEDHTNGRFYNMYSGNALAIVIMENKEQYQMYFFLADKQHVKNWIKDDPEAFAHFTFYVNNNEGGRKFAKAMQGVARMVLMADHEAVVPFYYDPVKTTE